MQESSSPVSPQGEPPPVSLASTSRLLLSLVKRGHAGAWNRLFHRLLPGLRRWARGRLPSWARARVDTDDLVQEAFVKIFLHPGRIEPWQRHALRAYLQESIRNRIRDEVRRAGRVEVAPSSSLDCLDPASSPLDRVLAGEKAGRYYAGLAGLEVGERELIVGRIELGLSYQQLALATGRPSPDAARVAVRRALLRLGEVIPGD